jgi:hypothetical protein
LYLRCFNKTEQPFKLAWDDSAYVDASSHTHRIIHAGVKYSDRNASQLSSLIPSKGKLSDFIYPSDMVTSGSGGWERPFMFPCAKLGNACEEKDRAFAVAHKGLYYKIILPFQVGTDMFTYTFTFKVNNVEILSDKKEDSVKKTPEVTP